MRISLGKVWLKMLVLVTVVAAVGGSVLLWRRGGGGRETAMAPLAAVEWVDYTDPSGEVSLKHPSSFVLGKVPEGEDGKEQFGFRLVRVNPPTLVRVWKEGLGVVAAFVHQPLLDYLKNNLNRRYASEFPDYSPEKLEGTVWRDLPAFSAWFTFQDPQKSYREKIRLTVVVKEQTAYYLQCMAPEGVWEHAEPSCDLIQNNFQFLR